MAESQDSGSDLTGQSLLLPLIHGRVRLLVLSFLMRGRRVVPFTRLRDELRLTDGTLSVHLGKLQQGGIVEIRKTFVGKKPLTEVKMTVQGRRLFRKYVADLQQIIPGLDGE